MPDAPDTPRLTPALLALKEDPEAIVLHIVEALPAKTVDRINSALARFVIFRNIDRSDAVMARAGKDR